MAPMRVSKCEERCWRKRIKRRGKKRSKRRSRIQEDRRRHLKDSENVTEVSSPPPILVCPNCGNSDRFIEIMAEEAHIVDGHLNYISLLESVTDHYICSECSESIEPPEGF